MSRNQEWANLGQDVKNAVEDALRSGDFSHLSTVISDTAAGALGLAADQLQKRGAGNAAQAQKPPHGQASGQGAGDYRRPAQPRQGAGDYRQPAQPGQSIVYRQAPAPAPFRHVGRVSAILYQVFGGVGTTVMACLAAAFLGGAVLFGGGYWMAELAVSALLVAFIVMVNVGIRQRLRLGRARQYREMTGTKHYINLEDIAVRTGKTRRYIAKDVKKMLRAGFFPEGHLDAAESCLMLDDRIFEEYLALEKERRMQERAGGMEEAARESADRTADLAQDSEEESRASSDAKLDAMIAEGQEYIRRLHELNDHIPGEVISEKLDRLERLLKEIFGRLRVHPEQMPQMQKFMNYYLPTTVKIVGAYEEFDALSVQGEDICRAKAEIERTLDTINAAFGELLNKLFRETAYDVTADAQVLAAMLAREGLADDMQNLREGE